MLLILEDEHKEHLEYLNSISFEVVCEFCRISVEFLLKGTNAKVYQSAAQKLGVETHVVQRAIEGLMQLFLESSKLLLSEIDFRDSVKALGFSDELQTELLHHYVENRMEIRRLQMEMSMNLPHYRDLEWRLDVQVVLNIAMVVIIIIIIIIDLAKTEFYFQFQVPDQKQYLNANVISVFQLGSRSLRDQVEPVITMKLHTEDGDDKKIQVLQTDPVNLIHLTRTLEEALQELNSAHCRRISRNF